MLQHGLSQPEETDAGHLNEAGPDDKYRPMSTLPSILLAMERAAKSVPLDPCGSVIGQLSSQFPRAISCTEVSSSSLNLWPTTQSTTSLHPGHSEGILILAVSSLGPTLCSQWFSYLAFTQASFLPWERLWLKFYPEHRAPSLAVGKAFFPGKSQRLLTVVQVADHCLHRVVLEAGRHRVQSTVCVEHRQVMS
ncbi:uncharacterized protein LOC124974542 isoform X3 [Sciurus carolinensis]|uniref:uncharacterized protein LOC124974542 isoform X3 n=1 Tax=Sciurus carolinensis TaxID=30640 RepID=UPI001FB24ADB|nr:uncharacterized protein LOC124974542 isoform X3 [Sciurus carolinensis]